MDEDQQQSIEDVWRKRKQVWLDTSKATLGPQQTQHKEWISTEILSKIETRRKLKDKINSSKKRATKREAKNQYNKVNQEVRKDSRRNKKKGLSTIWLRKQRQQQSNTG